ncbi:MAG: PEGA domain-containing protein [Candidatus Saccharibacteria bacterium]
MKKTRKPLQWLMYTIAIGVLIFGTIGLVYFAQGYSYDFKSGQIRNSGLVLIDSHPNGASISLNGKSISDKTPYRYDNATGGDISVNLQKNGYRDWTTKQTVVPGEVTFIEYPLLLPDNLPRQQIAEPVTLSGLNNDFEHKKAVSVSGQKDVYFITENGTATRIYSAGVNTIDSAEISPDGNRALIRQTNTDSSINQILVSTNGATVINLTAEYGFVFSNLQFSPQNSADLFWLENGLVRKIDTNNKSISSALLSDVISYSLSRDRIIATLPGTIPSLTNMIVSTNLSGSDRYDVAALPADTLGYNAILVHSRFHTYLAVLANSEPKKLYYIYEPLSRNALPFKIADNVTFFSASPKQKFLTYLTTDGIHSIDLETNREYHHALDTKPITAINWFDDYHVILQAGTVGTIIDFDGYNQQVITTNSTPGYLLPNDSKSLLYLDLAKGMEKVFLEAK